MGKSSKDKRDAYYRLAKEQQWRARSAFKLLQLDETFDLFGSDVSRVVDLCAAPGSWSQVLSRVLIKKECLGRRAWELKVTEEANIVKEGHPVWDDMDTRMKFLGKSCKEETRNDASIKIVAIDLQPIAPLEGIITLVGDITHPSTIPRILDALDADDQTKLVDLVLSDGAPDVTGLHDLDIYIQAQLLFSALNLAIRILRPGGTFVAKIFRGKDVDLIYAQLRCFFDRVSCAKPRSSRASSLEAFVVCQGFRMPAGFCPDDMLPLGSGGPASLLIPEGRATQQNAEFGAQGAVKSTVPPVNNKDDTRWIAPFVACGDLSAWDADATYHLPKDHVSLEPVRPPVDPPYKRALEERRRRGGFYGKTKDG